MSSQNILGWCLLLISLGLAGCTLTPSPVAGSGVTEAELSRAIESMSFQRGLAEHYVTLALAKVRDKPDLTQVVQNKYGHAAALANSLIDKLKFSLTLRKIDPGELAQDIKRVAVAVNELHTEVNLPRIDPKGGVTASAIEDLITPPHVDAIVKAAFAIWKAAQEREDKLIEDIKKELDRQRWKSWRELDTLV